VILKAAALLAACAAAFVAGVYIGLTRVFWPEDEA
jgi:hypothetical protein